MSRWFRHYAGMMRDDKLVRAALRAKQPIERTIWVYGAMLESAAEINDGGKFDFDAPEAAHFLGSDEADIRAIETSLVDCGRVRRGRLVKWGDRQFKSDDASDRVRRHRERKKEPPTSLETEGRQDATHNCNADETLHNAPDVTLRNPPELETERKKDAADAAPDDLERQLFNRGKEVAGKNAGGLIAKILKAKSGNVALARAAIEQASTKQNPREYLGKIAAGGNGGTNSDDPDSWKQAIV